MADSIDFGLLQPPPHPTAQVMTVPNYAAENSQALSSGITAGTNAYTSMQQNARENALQPGALAQQKAVLGQTQAQTGLLGAQTANAKLEGQKTQIEIGNAKYDIQQRQDRMAAYQQGKATGGTEAGLDAIQETYFKQGNVDAGLKMADAREKLKQQVADNNIKGVSAIASSVMGTVQDAKPDTKDPKTGQVIPGQTSLQIYAQRYPEIKKMYPDAPNPASFKSDQEYQDTFVHPVLDTAKDPIAQAKADHDALIKNDMYQSQQIVNQRIQELKTATQKFGPNAQETLDAAKALQQAQFNTQRISNGNNYIANTLKGGYKALMPESMGGDPSTNSLINKYTPNSTIVNPTSGLGKYMPKTGKNATTNQMFKAGQIAVDAKGNKATYMGGDPKDPASWKEVP